MSEFKDDLMKKIQSDEVKMRSKNFFVLMKALFEIAVISLILLAVFLLNVSFYLPRRRFEMMMDRPTNSFGFFLANTPWHFALIGIFAIAVAIWILYHYTGLYKKNLGLLLLSITLFILFIAFVVSRAGVNERLEKRRELRQIYPGQYERQFENRGPRMHQQFEPNPE
jgi:glucan phosphoethanolaminetransferase (alkaline phosphatase superfamily)